MDVDPATGVAIVAALGVALVAFAAYGPKTTADGPVSQSGKRTRRLVDDSVHIRLPKGIEIPYVPGMALTTQSYRD